MKNNIDKFKIEIKRIKDILDYTLKNMEHYYKIIGNMYNNFNFKKRNYTILTNINGINNDSILKDIQDIIKEENILNKFDKIYFIYNKMSNNIHNNLVKISNFNNMINVNNIPFYPINNNYIGNNNIYRLIQEIKELNGHIDFNYF